MKKLLVLAGLASIGLANAETVYVQGKAVDPKVVDAAMAQLKKNPQLAGQLNNPEVKKQILQSIGMQQAILAEGNAKGLDKTPAYQAKLAEVKPMVYAQIMQDQAAAKPVTDAQVKAKYDEMVAQAASSKQYKVSHILVKDQKTADEVEAQLAKGAKFSDLAKKYSIDPGSKANGGDLGWSDGSNFVPEFTKGMQSLAKGKYTTTPVKSQFGFHIIKVDDIKAGNAKSVPPFAKMKDQIKQQLQAEQTQSFIDGIKSQYKIEVK